MTRSENKLALPKARLNFLLGCSDTDLGSFELARLAEVANLRSDLHMILDRLVDEVAQAALAGWFREIDREKLCRAVTASPQENLAEIIASAKEQIRNQGRSKEELVPHPLIPLDRAHLAAVLRYQERNIAAGLCGICPKPLDRNSVRYCTRHLAMAGARRRPKRAKGEPPGSIAWLYEGDFESSRGRQPGSLKALSEARGKRKKKSS